MQQHLIYIFMIVIVILIMNMVIKKISKDTFCHQKWYNNVKKGKGRCENIDKKLKVYITITVVKAIWVVLIVHQNIETHFAYEDGDSDYGHMDVTHLDIIIFFAKANGNIDHLIDYESVKKIILIFTFIWRTNVDTSIKGCVLWIVQQLIQFSRVINFSLDW